MDEEALSWLIDNESAQAIQITRSKGASEVTVAKAVRSAMQQFQRSHPQLRLEEAYSSVTPVEENYRGSMHLLLEGALLAILVVWWFLRAWRFAHLHRAQFAGDPRDVCAGG